MAERYVLGLTEEVTLIGKNNKREKLRARIDTGATMSSLDKHWAEVLQLGPILEQKVVKSASGVTQRPLVKALVKINGTTIQGEFTLVDRSHMTFPLLIGQNILKKGKFLIDPLKRK